jgi:nitroreductase
MVKSTKQEKSLAEAIRERRATPSFDGSPIPEEDLRRILEAGLSAPSEHNVQPWRFVVVQSEEQKRRLRAAAYNQARLEEASAVIVACGDADAWRKDVDDIVRMGLEGGMPEGYAAQMPTRLTNYFSRFSSDEMHGWLNKMVAVAVTHMMLMAEVMGYDTAPLEGFEQDKVHEALRLPMSYWVVEFLAIGHLNGPDKFNSGRFDMGHTVFGEEFGKPLK